MNSSWSNVYFSLLLFVTVAGLAMCGLIGDRTEFNDEVQFNEFTLKFCVFSRGFL